MEILPQTMQSGGISCRDSERKVGRRIIFPSLEILALLDPRKRANLGRVYRRARKSWTCLFGPLESKTSGERRGGCVRLVASLGTAGSMVQEPLVATTGESLLPEIRQQCESFKSHLFINPE